MPTAESVAKEVAEEQGWSDDTLLGLVLDWVEHSGNGDALTHYLNERAEEENAECES